MVDECYQCKLCYVICPYTPDQQQEWRIDFPQLMLRSLAIQTREGKRSRSSRLLARTDLQGKVATALAPVVNASTHVKPVRVLMEKTTGIARDRLLPTFTRVRFSNWFRGANVSRPAPWSPRNWRSATSSSPTSKRLARAAERAGALRHAWLDAATRKISETRAD